MPMKPEEHKKIVDALDARVAAAKEKGVPPPGCPICGTDLWDVADEFVSIGTASALGVLTEGQYLPTIVLVCTNCGNQQFMNLAALGLGEIGTQDRQAPLVVTPTPVSIKLTGSTPTVSVSPPSLITMNDLKVKETKSGR